uniref:Uncharacterized protein n=1 Tax=Romanomermis culicivorax TaxID=13658 RepID=A0A915JCS7_ROMCU
MVESERYFETVATMDDDLNEKEVTLSLLNMFCCLKAHLLAFSDGTGCNRQNVTERKENFHSVRLATSQDYVRVRPGFGYLKAMSQCVLMVVIKPMLGRCEERPPQKDHVTILLAEAPTQEIRPVNPTKIWKNGSDNNGENGANFRDYPKNYRKLRLNLFFILKEDEEVEETTEESD